MKDVRPFSAEMNRIFGCSGLFRVRDSVVFRQKSHSRLLFAAFRQFYDSQFYGRLDLPHLLIPGLLILSVAHPQFEFPSAIV